MSHPEPHDVPWHLNPRDRSWTCPPAPADAYAFHRSLTSYAPTRVVEIPAIAAELGVGRVFVKEEADRFGLPSFKALGASWAVHRATREAGGGRTTIVAATDGNHGRAAARFAFLLGHDAAIFVPRGVHPSAVEAIRSEGAGVTEIDGDYDAAVAAAAEHAERIGGVLVQDMAWEGYVDIPSWIVEGYGTMFRELDEQLRELGVTPDLVVVPTGVGSLLQAAVTHYRSDPSRAATRVASVEPRTAACVYASLRAGRPTTVPTGETTMAGLNCGTVSALAWPLIDGGLDAALLADDADVLDVGRAMQAAGVDAGPCGTAPLAALRAARRSPHAAELYEPLGLGPDAVVVALATESSRANPLR